MTTFALDDDGAVQCDIDQLIVSRMLVEANSGGGKSRTLRRILEQTHGSVQQIVIDPEGEFGSLREKYDYVYAAPTGGDTVANPRSAALLAIRLLELRVSAIIDLYELPIPDRIRFVKLYFEAMINAPKKLWHPVMVVLDEAHVFAPEKGKGHAESTGTVCDMASRGRKRGFCALYATQRIQKLSKDATADLNNKIVGRATQSADVDRAAEEIGLSKADRRQLVDLEPGQFFVAGPAFDVKGIQRVKVGKVRTTHPEAGQRIAFTAAPPTSKIRALLPKLSDLPAEAEAERKTLADLQAENAQLKRELAAKPKPVAPAPPPAPKVIEVSVVPPAVMRQFDDARIEMLAAFDEIRIGLKKASATRLPTLQRVDSMPGRYVSGVPTPPIQKTETHVDAEEKLASGEYAVLVAIAQHGTSGVSREQISILTGFKRSTRDAYISRLRQKGLIGDEPFVATDGAHWLLGSDFEPLPTGQALREHWLHKLPQGEAAVLRVLIDAYPAGPTREDVSAATGFKRSTRDAYLSRLSTRKLAVALRGGQVQASKILFDA